MKHSQFKPQPRTEWAILKMFTNRGWILTRDKAGKPVLSKTF